MLAFPSQVLPGLDAQKALSTGLAYQASTDANQEHGPIRQTGKLRPQAQPTLLVRDGAVNQLKVPLAPAQAFSVADTGGGRAKHATVVGEAWEPGKAGPLDQAGAAVGSRPCWARWPAHPAQWA